MEGWFECFDQFVVKAIKLFSKSLKILKRDEKNSGGLIHKCVSATMVCEVYSHTSHTMSN